MQRLILLIACLLFFNSRILSQAPSSYVIKDIKSFGAKGDGKFNDHAAFQRAAQFFNARKGNGKLIISSGTYLVGKQIKGGNGAAWFGEDVLKLTGCSNMVIQGEKNATLKMQNGMRVGSFHPKTDQPFESKESQFTDYNFLAAPGGILYLERCRNVKVSDLQLDGNNKNVIKGGKFGDHGFQVPADGIMIVNSSGIVIENVKSDYFVRDGLVLVNATPQEWETPSQKITIINSSFTYNGRQGFSWVGGVGVRVINSKFNHTGRSNIVSAPAAGVDIEAEVGIIKDGTFINCEFVNNNGAGLVADSGPSKDMVFENCLFWGVTSWSMWTTKPNYNFYNCKFYGSIVQGYDSPDDANATKFFKCVFEDKPYQGKIPYGQYLVEINLKRRMLFNTCTFTTHTKKLFWFEGDPSWKDEEKPLIINCIIHVYPTPYKKPDFFAKMHGVRWSSATYFIYMPQKEYEASYYIPGSYVTFMGNTSVQYKSQKVK
ncbi:MAG: right-handed parallel beta-helix repeat-containing protein [Flavisolibacter sp.]|nr:right-handed parallel beta-helix repeat-containing protein [Flavisolibacter sp.]